MSSGVDTPDPAVNVMVNSRMLYQTLSCRLWGRAGFYQSGGAKGAKAWFGKGQRADLDCMMFTNKQRIKTFCGTGAKGVTQKVGLN